MTHTIISHDYHRNGVGGQSFIIVKFVDSSIGTLIATINNATNDMFIIDPLDITRGFSSDHFTDILDYAKSVRS